MTVIGVVLFECSDFMGFVYGLDDQYDSTTIYFCKMTGFV